MKSARDALTDAAAQWVRKAENDLTTAVAVTRLGGEYPTDSVCFHAQQCAEKYYKAVLVYHGIDFPRTHDLNALARLLPGLLLPTLTDEERRRLTYYAVSLRYPGDYDPIPIREARHALALARRVRRGTRRMLPRATITRKASS